MIKITTSISSKLEHLTRKSVSNRWNGQSRCSKKLLQLNVVVQRVQSCRNENHFQPGKKLWAISKEHLLMVYSLHFDKNVWELSGRQNSHLLTAELLLITYSTLHLQK